MKTRLSGLLACTLMIFALSCSKSKTTVPAVITPGYYFKAKIDGIMYDGNTFLCAKRPDTPVAASATCFINYKSTSYGISVAIDEYKGPGTYKGGKTNAIALSLVNSADGYQTLQADSTMVIKITEDDNNTAKGEFSGKLFDKNDPSKDSIVMTEGSFYIQWVK